MLSMLGIVFREVFEASLVVSILMVAAKDSAHENR